MPRYAIKTPPQHATWNEFLDVWRAADEIDVFESAWNWDHYLGFAEEDDPAVLRDRAASFFDVGVDVVVWSMRGTIDASRLEPLANALA